MDETEYGIGFDIGDYLPALSFGGHEALVVDFNRLQHLHRLGLA